MVRYKNILVPLDSCGQSEPILSQLPPLVRQTGITVHLLSVYPPTMHTVVGRHVVIYGYQREAQANTAALRSLDKAGLIWNVRLCAVDTQHVALYINAAHNSQVEVWGVQKQLAAFEKVFGRQFVIKVRQQTSAHGVSARRGMLVQPGGS